MRIAPMDRVFALALAGTMLSTSPAHPRCGAARWDTKIGRDTEAGSINLAASSPTTIADLTDKTLHSGPLPRSLSE